MNTGNATTAEAACTDALPGAALSGPVSHAVSRVARLHRIAAGSSSRGWGSTRGRSS
ncbi:Ranscriptional regulator OS=Streptomyces microflavus OX=1919 GN=G3I39_04395 PE=4 SV=1 [Streptomyces microflavus]